MVDNEKLKRMVEYIAAAIHTQELDAGRRRKKDVYNRLFHAIEACRSQHGIMVRAHKVMVAAFKEEQEVLDRYLSLLAQLEAVHHQQSLEESAAALKVMRFIGDNELGERYQQWCVDNDVPF